MKKIGLFIAILTLIAIMATFTSCLLHQHELSTEWKSDADGHWQTCLDESCAEKFNNDRHTYGEGKVTTPATEQAEGVMTYECKVCGYEKTEAIEKLQHKHTYESSWSSDDNYHWIASSCGHDDKDKGVHIFDEGWVEKEATDTENGIMIYTCITCGYYYEEEIISANHTHTYSDEWTADENKHWHAADCGHDKKRGVEDHDFDNGLVTKDPTEDEEGITSYTCKTCGYVKEEPIDKLPHTHRFAEEWSKDEQHHWHASLCDHDETIVLYFHKYDDGQVTTDPTDSAEGVKTFTCTECGQTKTEAIPSLSHTHTYETTYSKDATHHWFAPTCGHNGAIVKVAHSYDANGNCVCGAHGVCETCGGCLIDSCTEHSDKCAFRDTSKVVTFVPQANYIAPPEGPNGLSVGEAGAYYYEENIRTQFGTLNGANVAFITLPNGTSAHSGISFWNNQYYNTTGREGYNVAIPQYKNQVKVVRMHFTNTGTSEISFKYSVIDWGKDKGAVTLTLLPGETKTVLMSITFDKDTVGLNHQIIFTEDAAANSGVAVWGEFIAEGLDKGISIDTSAKKLTFYVGESFTSQGLIIKGSSNTQSNGGDSWARVYIYKNFITSYAEGYKFTSADAGTQTVTVTFAGQTTTYTISVIDHSVEECKTCGKCTNQICEYPGCGEKCEGHFDANTLTMMSFNLGTNGVNNSYNKSNLLNKLLTEMPDLLGTQEENSLWTTAIGDTLARYGYKNVIMYRNGYKDSDLGNEGAGIWYNSLRFELVECGYFWMSDTPDTSSIWSQYGAIYKRVTTWAKLTDKASGKTFVYYNTHIGYESEELWVRSAQMIMERMHAHYNEGYPVIVTGDFNFALNTEGAPEAYAVFMKGLSDPHYSATVRDYEEGKQNTFNGHGEFLGGGTETGSDVGNRKHILPIDYMLYSAGFVADYYTILREELPEGVTGPDRQYYSSDHFAIKTIFSFSDDWGKHICWEPCSKCGLCLDGNCETCAEKCPGHHKCDTLCPDCGLCANLDGECPEENHCPAYKITLNGATFENGTNVTYGCKLTANIVLNPNKTFEVIIDNAKNYYTLETIKNVEITGNVKFTVLYQEDMLAYAASDKPGSKNVFGGVSATHVLNNGIYMTRVTFAKGTEAGKFFAGRGANDSGSMPINWCAPAKGKNIGIIYIYNYSANPVKIQYMTENYGEQNEELFVTLEPGLNRIVLTFGGMQGTYGTFYSCDHRIILVEDAAEEIVLDTYGYILPDGLIEDVALASAPTKLTYKVGETFTTEGMSITVKVYGMESYITNATVDYEGKVFTADDIGTHTVTVTFRDFTATFEIEVTE